MARDPGSVWAPLPEAGAPDGYEKTQFIVHSTGDNGTAAATRRFFAGATLNESTFIVGQGPDDPTLQIMDSTDVADANGSANRRGISVEVAGDGVGGYNAWQRSELVRLGRWARAAHPGILPRIIPAHTEPGFGWHVMFGAPGPWAGVAKVCPGKQRIKELQADIFPAIFAGTPLSEEDDMTPEQAQQLADLHDWVKGDPGWPNNILQAILDDTGDIQRRVLPVGANIDSFQDLQMRIGWVLALLAKPADLSAVPTGDLRAIAQAVNDEADRRQRDGDPTTGSVS